jgi:hypothetical protein
VRPAPIVIVLRIPAAACVSGGHAEALAPDQTQSSTPTPRARLAVAEERASPAHQIPARTCPRELASFGPAHSKADRQWQRQPCDHGQTPCSRGHAERLLGPYSVPDSHLPLPGLLEQADYQAVCRMEPTGIEPVTSCLQSAWAIDGAAHKYQ